ncbi:hypothetical protein HPY42_04295 [Coprothermobacteraceae bacterium]|nr:hypothetical protein [Coprothermobacteraceae bacterium]
MEKHLRWAIAVIGAIIIFLVGAWAQTEMSALRNPEWVVLLPYETYMGNVWEVNELPAILDELSSRGITGLVYYPGQDLAKIVKGLQGRILVVGKRPEGSNQPLTWINLEAEEQPGAFIDLSFESLTKEPETASLVRGKDVCAREELSALVGQHLWASVNGIYGVSSCPADGILLGYAESLNSTVVMYDVRSAVMSALDGYKVKKVVLR